MFDLANMKQDFREKTVDAVEGVFSLPKPWQFNVTLLELLIYKFPQIFPRLCEALVKATFRKSMLRCM